MALLAEALSTLANTKRALGVPSANTTDDTLITDLINAATRQIEKMCGRKLVRRDYNSGGGTHATTSVTDEPYVIWNGDGESSVKILPTYPVVASGFVFEELATRDSGGETWTELTLYVDYVLDDATGILRLLDWKFAKGTRNYRVTMEAGYKENSSAPFAPPDLERACHELVKQEYRNLGTVVSETIAGWSRSFNQDKSASFVERTIAHYRSDANLI